MSRQKNERFRGKDSSQLQYPNFYDRVDIGPE
jgi:hypothetical protein